MAVMAIMATAFTALGGAVSAIGTFSAMRSQQAMANYQARVASQQSMIALQQAEYNARVVEMQTEYNAKVAEVQAESRRRLGALQEQDLRRQGRRIIGQQAALYSAAGLDLEGTPLLVMADTVHNVSEDVMRARAGTEYGASMLASEAGLERLKGQLGAGLERYKGQTTSQIMQTQSDLYRMKASTYGSAGWYSLGGSLLTTGARTLAMGQQTGLWSK